MTSKENHAVQALVDVTPITDSTRGKLIRGVGTQVYGPFLERMVTHATVRIEAGAIDPQPAVSALQFASALYVASDRKYSRNVHALRGELLERHQANVLDGTIALVPESAAVTQGESVAQVLFANDLLNRATPQTEAALSALNYGSMFREGTMASATRTLDRREIEDLIETADSTQESMPHLSVSNWAIGQTVAGIYRELARPDIPKRLRVIDIGSGHGSTIAAITNSLQHVEDIDKRPDLAITALETTPEFYAELTRFAENDQAAADLRLERVRKSSDKADNISEFGALTTINADAITTIKNADLSDWMNEDDVTVVTANYAFHRLPQTSKNIILERFSHLPNVIFLIGDLAQNTSTINRRYFNLAANGPLNPGNRNLTRQISKFGYDQVDLEKLRPASLDSRLARRISNDHRNNDGHLWIAYSGIETLEALNLVPAA